MAGAALALLIGAVAIGSAARKRGPSSEISRGPVEPAAVVVAPVTPEPAPATSTNAAGAANSPGGETTPGTDTGANSQKGAGDGSGAEAKPEERPDPEVETAVKLGGASGRGKGASAVTAADNRKLLEEAERLLRAERFPEARDIFTRLTKSRRDRGPALVGLAEISFQEKNYTEAVRSAERAADRGGGVRARVLLGDAHFRLNQFKEAAKAYEDALRIDPRNASARSGLALANKRM